MKSNNQVEVILFSKYAPKDSRQKEMIKWLGTTAQYAIRRQEEKTRKLFFRLLKDAPPVYMS